MENLKLLHKYGLFDAKVPRYSSYPTADRFTASVDRKQQTAWLTRIDAQQPVSIYIHIPFCHRLCSFCACRTQGTRTMAPVQIYLEHLFQEIRKVASLLPGRFSLSRLWLGGGTPTLMKADQMNRLLDLVFSAFSPVDGFEFSIELDPSAASLEMLRELSSWNLNRAVIAFQDITPEVQVAIGRRQSFEETLAVTDRIRSTDIKHLDVEMLYGLPCQTQSSILRTIEQVHELHADRLTICGYAHIPLLSRRQRMIDTTRLPGGKQRYLMYQGARRTLTDLGYEPIGTDLFTKKSDRLYHSALDGQLRWDFRGHHDDPAHTLLGFGASAISRFHEGFTQNNPATSAYIGDISQHGFAARSGIEIGDEDRVVSRIIEELLCYQQIDVTAQIKHFPAHESFIRKQIARLARQFPAAFFWQSSKFKVSPAAHSLIRVIATSLVSGNMQLQRFNDGKHTYAI